MPKTAQNKTAPTPESKAEDLAAKLLSGKISISDVEVQRQGYAVMMAFGLKGYYEEAISPVGEVVSVHKRDLRLIDLAIKGIRKIDEEQEADDQVVVSVNVGLAEPHDETQAPEEV